MDAGASQDLDDATRMAWNAIAVWGMDEEMGSISLEALASVSKSREGWLFDLAQQRIQVLMKRAYARTEEIVSGHWAEIEVVATTKKEAQDIAARISYPVLVRPSYVLGGRGMEIVYDDQSLAGFISRATEITPGHPVLVDRFLDNAIEIDVDALFDGEERRFGGIAQHRHDEFVEDAAAARDQVQMAVGERVKRARINGAYQVQSVIPDAGTG